MLFCVGDEYVGAVAIFAVSSYTGLRQLNALIPSTS